MEYAFILGRQPGLSLAELTRAVPHLEIKEVWGEVCIAQCNELLPGFINCLGGTIKIVQLTQNFNKLEDVTAEQLRLQLPDGESRVIFGISLYGTPTLHEARSLYMQGLNLKKAVKSEGRRARYVVSKEKQLSSVVVTKNKLIEEGAEFVVIKTNRGVRLGKTVAVQPFEEYGIRDFDRPGRSAYRGMLPPKLAQMMVNIAHGDKNLPFLDPFCGSGTVLGEALLLGYTQVIGSDVSEEAVHDTTEYLRWLEEKHPEFIGRWKVHVTDVRLLAETIDHNSIGAIATEPYLGPPQSGRETPAQLQGVLEKQLVPLYTETLSVFEKLLAPNGAACIAFPVYGKGQDALHVPVAKIAGHLKREPLLGIEVGASRAPHKDNSVYERPGQHVAREITILKK